MAVRMVALEWLFYEGELTGAWLGENYRHE
jgi:hypothetical protein